MDSDSVASLAYLGLLGAAIAGWFFMQNRQSLGRTMQQLLVWVLIFLGVIGAYGIWNDISNSARPSQIIAEGNQIEIPRRRDGHFYITAKLDGVDIDFIVDTGATEIVLSKADARRLGFNPDDLLFLNSARTANGEVGLALVVIEQLELGPLLDENIRAWVNEGELDTSLLGMSYLSLFQSIEIRGNELILTR